MQLDRVVCLSLDKRVSERTIDREIKTFGIKKVEIFLCGEGKLYPSYLYDWIDEPKDGRAQAWNYSKCLQKILWKSWKNGDDNILFLEDDAIINSKINKPLHYFIDILSHLTFIPDWDMLYLGGNIQNGQITNIKIGQELSNIVHCTYILDMQATIFHRRSFEKILSIDPSNECTIDGVIALKQQKGELNAFSVAPVLITQKANWSYNENRMVDRAANHIL